MEYSEEIKLKECEARQEKAQEIIKEDQEIIRECQLYMEVEKAYRTEQQKVFRDLRETVEDLTNQIGVIKNGNKYCQELYQKALANLDEATKVIEDYKNNLWFHDLPKPIAYSLGILLETLLEATVWPYATLNSNSLFYKSFKAVFKRNFGVHQRMIITICTTIVWVLTIYSLSLLVINIAPSQSMSQDRENLDNKNDNKTDKTAVKNPKPVSSNLNFRGGYQLPMDHLQLQCLLTIKQIKLRHQLTEIKNFVETQPTKTRIGQMTKGFKRKSKYLILGAQFLVLAQLLDIESTSSRYRPIGPEKQTVSVIKSQLSTTSPLIQLISEVEEKVPDTVLNSLDKNDDLKLVEDKEVPTLQKATKNSSSLAKRKKRKRTNSYLNLMEENRHLFSDEEVTQPVERQSISIKIKN